VTKRESTTAIMPMVGSSLRIRAFSKTYFQTKWRIMESKWFKLKVRKVRNLKRNTNSNKNKNQCKKPNPRTIWECLSLKKTTNEIIVRYSLSKWNN
jgi:hypothetical protein